MELNVYNQDGSESGRSVSLDASIFGIEPNDHVIWLDVRRIQAHARQGTHKAKERSEVAGSTRKLYRQKGTGHARAGSAKSPIRRSGGTIFGPRPHKYSLKINRKTQRLARRSALSYKAQGEAIRIVEDFSMDTPSTRQLIDLLGAMDLADRKVLILTGELDAALYRSSVNARKVTVRRAAEASTLDLMDAQVILCQESGLTALNEILGTEAPEAADAETAAAE